MVVWTKRPAEAYAQAIEFSGKLPTGASVSTATGAAINRETGADATATVIDSVTVSGTQVIVKGKAGASPVDYLLTITVTLSPAATLIEEILLQVRLAMSLVATPGFATANSYPTRIEADAYHQVHLYNSVWLAADDWKKEAALIWATRVLDEQVDWSGSPTNTTQALRWPRSGVLDREGQNYLDKDLIPTFLKRATAEFARYLLTENRTEERGFGISSVTADSVTVEFDKHDVKPILPPSVRSIVEPYGTVLGPGSGTAKLVRV